MQITKKVISLLLVLTMLVSLGLTGCGDKKETTDAAASTAATTTEATKTQAEAPKLDPVDLTWYYFGNDPGPDKAAVETAMNDYMKDKINATIKLYPLAWDEYIQKTNAMLAAGEAFDIAFSPVWINWQENVGKGMFMDITSLFPQYCPKTAEIVGQDMLAGGMVGGKLYAVPTYKEKAHAYGFMFNKQLLDKYSLDISNITGLKDVEPMLEVIKKNEPGIIPINWAGGPQPDYFLPFYHVLGDDVIPMVVKEGETKLQNPYEVPEFIDMFRTIKTYNAKGYLPKDAAVMKVDAIQALKDEGKVFCYIENTIPGRDKSVSKEKVTWVQKQITKPWISNKDLGGSQNSISSTSKNPERALMFLELLNTDKAFNNILAYGIQDKHYKKIDDNTIERIPNSGYSHDWQWAFANQTLNFLQKGDDPNKWTNIDAFNKEAKTEPAFGFDYNLDKWKQVTQAVKTVVGECYLGVGVGDVDKELAKVNSKLKAAGYYDFLADVQKAYDEWNAKKK